MLNCIFNPSGVQRQLPGFSRYCIFLIDMHSAVWFKTENENTNINSEDVMLLNECNRKRHCEYRNHNSSVLLDGQPNRKCFSKFVLPVGIITSLILFGTVIMYWYFVIDTEINYKLQRQGSNVMPETISESFSKAAVVTNAPPCATIGKNILLKGGNAVDAIIGAMICDGVTILPSMGIGGGFVMVIYNKTHENVTVINAREKAPGASTVDMFHEDPKLSRRGGLTVAVPGEVKGYWTAYQKYGGGVPWKELFEPTIKLCRDGIPINENFANKLRRFEENIRADEQFRTLFINPINGLLKTQGDTYTNPKLARTLKVIAENGGNAFYEGSIAKSLVKDIRDNGGIITEEDLRNYDVSIEDPYFIPITNHNITLYSANPPSSGIIPGYIISLLNGLLPAGNELLNIQRMTEAMKYGYAVRNKLGDPKFVDLKNLLSKISSAKFIQEIQQKISDKRTWNDTAHYEGDLYSVENKGTANFAVLAENGDAVVATSTINLDFGSFIISKSTGILLNDEMDDFSSPNITNYFGVSPSVVNFIRPYKMPLSSMCPTIIVDNNNKHVKLLIGASGGTRISSSVSIVISRILFMKESTRKAIDNVLFHHQLLPMVWQYYPEMSNDIVLGMQRIGHEVALCTNRSVVSAIDHFGEKINANCDRTRPGHIDGY